MALNRIARLLVVAPFRIVVMTFAFSAMTMAVGLFCGLLVVVIGAAIQGQQPDVAMAYRNVAFPLVKVAVVVSLVAATAIEVRHFLRSKS